MSMRAVRRGAAALAAVLLLAACGGDPEPQRHGFFAFGTWVELSLAGVDKDAARAARDAVSEEFQRLHGAWHAWEPGPLGDVNAALARGEAVAADPELAELIARARPLAAASGGLFDPGIGALVALWGFHSEAPGPAPPAPEAIDAWLAARPGIADLDMDGERLHTDKSLLHLDFGAFAKGVAVERALAILRRLGIEHAIVNAGGDLGAMGWAGGRAGSRPWRIGIRHPRAEGVLATLELAAGEAVFTSGDYERFFIHEGRRHHHILDPRSGRPAEGAVAVTVVHPQAALADAAATALFVAGPGGWRAVAAALGVDQAMLIDADGGIHMTEALARRLQFDIDPATGLGDLRP